MPDYSNLFGGDEMEAFRRDHGGSQSICCPRAGLSRLRPLPGATAVACPTRTRLSMGRIRI